MSRNTVVKRIAAAVAIAAAAAACGGASGHAPEERLVVSAAASLSDVFTQFEAEFEAANPAVDVELNVGGSSALREQVIGGAPVDVVAMASPQTMEPLVATGAVAAPPRVFAANDLVVAVPADNPAGVTGLGDFSRGELLIGLCAAGVPCGDLAREALATAGVDPAVDTNEPNVRALLTKIASGELDAGITYATDIAAGGDDVRGVTIPVESNVSTEYVIAPLVRATHPETADLFVQFVLSAEGRETLATFGFSLP